MLGSLNHFRSPRSKVSPIVVRRTLRKSGFSARCAARKLTLNSKDRSIRLRWARLHASWSVRSWQRVIFTDESKFGLSSDGRVLVWRRRGERFVSDCLKSRSKARISIMVWGALCSDGSFALARIDGKGRMTGEKYKQLLIRHGIGRLPPNKLFQDDNARIHRAKVVENWKRNKGVRSLLSWPPYSPDLSPIENVWGIIKNRIANRLVPISTLAELEAVVHTEYAAVCGEFAKKLYESMPRRIEKVIAAKGYPIRY